MDTKTYHTYEEAAADYLAQFGALRAAPAATGAATRGGAGLAADALIEQADRIATVSASMVPLARGYLDAKDRTLREGMSAHLLAQAAAELQVATELLKMAEAGGAAKTQRGTRGIGGASLRTAIDNLEEAMALPVSADLAPRPAARRGVRAVAATAEDAKSSLKQVATTTTDAIAARVCEFGGDVAFDLVLNTQWGAVVDGIGLLRKDIAAKLEAIQAGAAALIQRAVAVASKTLLNVYDKLLALFGKGAEDTARKKVKDWLEKIKAEGKIDLFAVLVNQLYALAAFQADLTGWLEKTAAGPEVIGKAEQDVSALGGRFATLVQRMTTLENAIGLAKTLKLPQVLAIVAGLQVALLAALVYVGNDYIGYREVKFLSLTRGVAQVIQGDLLGTA